MKLFKISMMTAAFILIGYAALIFGKDENHQSTTEPDTQHLTMTTTPKGTSAEKAEAAFFPVRFKVLEVKKNGEPKNGFQSVILKLSPWYGKIEAKSFEFRKEVETQELTMIMLVKPNYAIKPGDILSFKVSDHLKF